MDKSPQERRKESAPPERPKFGVLVRAAMQKRIPESRQHAAVWMVEPNLGWVRWTREDGRHVYCAIRRRIDWITGEIGASPEAVHVNDLVLVHSLSSVNAEGCRIQLGMMLHGQDKWWSSGGSEKTLIERLDWIAMQLQLRIFSFLSANVSPKV